MHQPSATAPDVLPGTQAPAPLCGTLPPLLPLPPVPVTPLLPLQWLEQRLLENYQHDFPLTPRPYLTLAQQLGVTEAAVIARFTALQSGGYVSRIGAVFQPNVVGASTLAALAVAPHRLEQVAQLVNRHAEVNHNYAREHRYNLWFVVTAADNRHRDAVLAKIEQDCESGPVLKLPLLEQFHIDLGFTLGFGHAGRQPDATGLAMAPAIPVVSVAPVMPVVPRLLSTSEQTFMATLQDGLPLTPQPYAQLGLPETDALNLLADWRAQGVIKRFGVIVRHHELGFNANAMVVWDIPDSLVADIGRRIAATGAVSLCYRRPRSLPDWPYNLFCMLHGKDRASVELRIAAIVEQHGLASLPHAVLFSHRRYKQCGARYISECNRTPVHG